MRMSGNNEGIVERSKWETECEHFFISRLQRATWCLCFNKGIRLLYEKPQSKLQLKDYCKFSEDIPQQTRSIYQTLCMWARQISAKLHKRQSSICAHLLSAVCGFVLFRAARISAHLVPLVSEEPPSQQGTDTSPGSRWRDRLFGPAVQRSRWFQRTGLERCSPPAEARREKNTNTSTIPLFFPPEFNTYSLWQDKIGQVAAEGRWLAVS